MRRGPGQGLRRFCADKKNILFTSILCVLVLFAVLQPLLPGQKDPKRIFNDPVTGLQYVNLPPCREFLLGTNAIGQDIWARLWAGTRTSLLIGGAVALIRVSAGTAAGIVWGYLRKTEWIFTELYNIFSNIPGTLVLILLSCALRPGMGTMILALCITGWLSPARMIRNKVLTVRVAEYNTASVMIGAGAVRIMRKNILPELASVIAMQLFTAVPEAVGSEVFVTYLGIGLSGDSISLGTLIQSARPFLGQPGMRYRLFVPVFVLVLITLSLYVTGSGAADAAAGRNTGKGVKTKTRAEARTLQKN